MCSCSILVKIHVFDIVLHIYDTISICHVFISVEHEHVVPSKHTMFVANYANC